MFYIKSSSKCKTGLGAALRVVWDQQLFTVVTVNFKMQNQVPVLTWAHFTHYFHYYCGNKIHCLWETIHPWGSKHNGE